MEITVTFTEANRFTLVAGEGNVWDAVVVWDGPRRHVAVGGHIVTLGESEAEVRADRVEDDVVAGVQTIKAPMPGKVVKVAAAEGTAVAKGQPVVIVEAMKMEHPLVAAGEGVVQKILCQEGQNVDASQPLAEVLIGGGS